MVDRVLHVVRGNLDRQADAVSVELLDQCLHRRAIESERLGLLRSADAPRARRTACRAAAAIV